LIFIANTMLRVMLDGSANVQGTTANKPWYFISK